MAEVFKVVDYLRCDCADVKNQTCDKCAIRAHIKHVEARAMNFAWAELKNLREQLRLANRAIQRRNHTIKNLRAQRLQKADGQ